MRKASVFIISIWVLSFFAILSVGLYKVSSTNIKVTRRLEERVISQYLAKAACNYVKKKRQIDTTSHITFYKLRGQNDLEMGQARLFYALVDEARKININTISLELLGSLPGLVNNPDLIKQIYESPLKPFKVKEEVLLVEGLDAEVFDAFKDLITVYGSNQININTAGRKVLEVIGMNPEVIDLIEEYRLGVDGKLATYDDGVFENTGSIITELSTFGELGEAKTQNINSLISKGLLGTSSTNFSIEVQTIVLGKAAMRYNIVMDNTKIKEWREY